MSDLLSAASLLMAVVAILYSLWYPELVKALEVKPAKYKEDNVGSKKQVQNVLLGKALPLSVMALIVALVFLPDAVNIVVEAYNECVTKGSAATNGYDAVRTAYVIVFIFSLVLAFFVWILAFKILNIWRDLRG